MFTGFPSLSLRAAPSRNIGIAIFVLGLCASACKTGDEKSAAKETSSSAPAPQVLPEKADGKKTGDAVKGQASPGAPGATGPVVKGLGAASAKDSNQAPGVGAEPQIIVEEVGQNPILLRYQFAPGIKKKFSMKMGVEPKVTVNGQALPQAGKTTFDVLGKSEILSVLPDGTARRLSSFDRFTPVAGGLPADALSQLKGQLGLLAGLKIEEHITPRGLLVSAEVVEIPAQDPGMQAMIKNLQDGLSNAVMPLPEQGIGKGGRFRTQMKIDAMGMALSQTTHFTIESIEGDVVKVKVTTEQSTPPAVMENASLPPGTRVELLGFKGTGQGTVTLNLKTLDMTSQMNLSMNIQTKTEAPGAPGPITSTTENRLSVSVKVSN
jgi:Family of unknown function (DUF6263)